MISDELKTRGRMPLVLPGWDRFSVWGWDGAEGSLFAQLWMNSDNSRDEPRVWITPGMGLPRITSVDDLARFIQLATGAGDDEVRQALTRCAPQSVRDELLSVAA